MNNYVFENYVLEVVDLYITTLADASNLEYILKSFYGLDTVYADKILSTAKKLIDIKLGELL